MWSRSRLLDRFCDILTAFPTCLEYVGFQQWSSLLEQQEYAYDMAIEWKSTYKDSRLFMIFAPDVRLAIIHSFYSVKWFVLHNCKMCVLYSCAISQSYSIRRNCGILKLLLIPFKTRILIHTVMKISMNEYR